MCRLFCRKPFELTIIGNIYLVAINDKFSWCIFQYNIGSVSKFEFSALDYLELLKQHVSYLSLWLLFNREWMTLKSLLSYIIRVFCLQRKTLLLFYFLFFLNVRIILFSNKYFVQKNSRKWLDSLQTFRLMCQYQSLYLSVKNYCY